MTTPIQKACVFLITKAFPKYDAKTCNHCAQAVRSAFDFAFGKHIERVSDAKDYGPSYEKIGFKKVFSHPEGKIFDYQPVFGDICIIQPVVEKGEIFHPHGHICVFTSKGWISDFVQNDMFGGSIRDKNPNFIILRYEPTN